MNHEIIAPVINVIGEGSLPTITKWYKTLGEKVVKGDHLLDIRTDITVMEIRAEVDGILEDIIHKEGATIIARTVVGIIHVTQEETFKLLGTRIAIEILRDPHDTTPHANGNFIQKGTIVKMGTGITPGLLKEGQTILYITDWSHEIEVGGKIMTILNEDEIIAIIG